MASSFGAPGRRASPNSQSEWGPPQTFTGSPIDGVDWGGQLWRRLLRHVTRAAGRSSCGFVDSLLGKMGTGKREQKCDEGYHDQKKPVFHGAILFFQLF